MPEMLPIEDRPGYFVTRDGQVWSESTQKFLKPTLADSGYRSVNLPYARNKYRVHHIHRLVAKAFILNPEGLPNVLHGDNDRSNNAVDNLRWGTQSENIKQSVSDGTHYGVNKTHCPSNHEYTEENTYLNPENGYRLCRLCMKLRRLSRSLEPDDPRHGTATGYGNWNCRCDSCREARRYYVQSRRDKK